MPDGVAQTSDRTSGDTLISATAPAPPAHAQPTRSHHLSDHVAITVVCGTPATYSPRAQPSTAVGGIASPCGRPRAVPSAIHSVASSTALAPSALAESPPVASSNWRTTSAASRPRSLTFRPCARAQFRTASLCASEPLLLAPPPEPARLGARRRLAVALFAPPVRPRVPCPGPPSGPLRPVPLSRCQQRAARRAWARNPGPHRWSE